MVTQSARQLAFSALRSVQEGAFVDVALDRVLHSSALSELDRSLVTELVYGSVRRRRTLDALIDRFAKKKAHQQPPDLRLILHLGFYQLRYLDHIPTSAAVNTTVDLAKQNRYAGLAGVVNGILRQYGRLKEAGVDPLPLPEETTERLAVQYSYPNWIVQIWLEQFGLAETEKLCDWFNQVPPIYLRVNPLRSSMAEVEAVMQAAGVTVDRLPDFPQALKLGPSAGAIWKLPGYEQGWWSVQDVSAQLVGHLINPQPEEVVVDACAAPGGKTTHIAELMGDRGTVWACDRTASRLKRLQENMTRLGLQSIQIRTGDSRELTQFADSVDRVLLDVPCSGLGTLHRHADARWRQTPENVQELAQLQRELLDHAATWVKPGGILVYATCTLHPLENEAVIRSFLDRSPQWQIEPPNAENPAARFVAAEGWIKVLPHQHQMDGFFMATLRRL